MDIQVGDYIKSELRPFICGFVTRILITGTKWHKYIAYVVETSSGKEAIIFDNDAVFIAR